MNTKRIEEIQKETAYPDSISVQQALLKVWNECEQEKAVKNNAVSPLVSNSVCDCCVPRPEDPFEYDNPICEKCGLPIKQTDC